MITAWTRVARAPGLILVVVGAHLALALAVGSSVRAAVGASLGRYAVLPDGHLFGSFLELVADHPAVFAGARQLLAGSALFSLALGTLLAAAVIERLRAPMPPSEVAAAALRGLPGVLVVTLWHLIPRLIVLALGAAVAGRLMRADTWGWLGVLFLIAVLGYVACALDLARCHVVLHGARRFHPMTALRGFLQAARSPGVLVPSLVMSFGQWACVLGILGISISGLGTAYAPWAARALAVLGVLFGLTRIAVAVGADPPARPAPAPDPARGPEPPTAAPEREAPAVPPIPEPPDTFPESGPSWSPGRAPRRRSIPQTV